MRQRAAVVACAVLLWPMTVLASDVVVEVHQAISRNAL